MQQKVVMGLNMKFHEYDKQLKIVFVLGKTQTTFFSSSAPKLFQ